MTVQKDVTKNIYVGNGSTRTFPFTFECPAEHPEYIKVYLMQDDGTALATSDYQLDMDARQITYPSSGTALPEGKKLVIMRELPLQQMMNLVNNGPYFAEDIETALDESIMALQQIAEKLNRTITMSVDIDGAAFVNEVPFEAGKSFRIADDGKSIVLTEDPARVLPTVQNLATAAETSAKQARFNAESAANHVRAAERESQNAQEYAKKAKDISENVNVFIPAVDADGTLTWTNKAGLANPTAVNIKGAKGEKGDTGAKGAAGAQGPQGVQGLQGPAGNAATITIGNVTTSAPGTLASVTNRGTSSAAVLDFVLPKGKDGADGGVTVDGTLSATSTNPVQNKVIKDALDNKAELDEGNIFSNNNVFRKGVSLFAYRDLDSAIKWYGDMAGQPIASIDDTNYTGNAASATKATQDSAGNIITETYTKKADFDKIIGELGVAFQQKADKSDLAAVATSGKYTDLKNRPAYVVQSVNNVKPDSNGNVSITVSGGGVTVDEEISSTSTNPVQNKVIYNALQNKVGTDIFSGFALLGVNTKIMWREGTQVLGSINATTYAGTADKATKDGAGNVITETYAKKSEVSGITVDEELSNTSTNAIQNKAVYSALSGKLGKTETAYAATKATQDSEGNVITETYAKKTDVSGMVKSVNNIKPDSNGNVTITVSSGSDVTVDTTLSSTSNNAIANKAVYSALSDKLDKTGTAQAAKKDESGNVIADTYATKTDVAIGLSTKLSTTGTAQAALTATKALQDGDGHTITSTYATKADVSGVVKSVNGVQPDDYGNVSITVGGGGVSTSTENTWTAKQNSKLQ